MLLTNSAERDVPAGRTCPEQRWAEPALLFATTEKMASKAAVDFSKVLASGLGKQTAADLVAFRKRSDEARRVVSQLKQLPSTVDFSHYKNVLKVGCARGAVVTERTNTCRTRTSWRRPRRSSATSSRRRTMWVRSSSRSTRSRLRRYVGTCSARE